MLSRTLEYNECVSRFSCFYFCHFSAPYEAISHDDDYSDVDNDEEFEDNYEYPSNISIDQQGSSAAIICKCRVLYDFNSSMSTELTVKEGKGLNSYSQMLCNILN